MGSLSCLIARQGAKLPASWQAAARRRLRRVSRLRSRSAAALRSLRETFTLPAPFPSDMEHRFLVDYGHRFAPFRRAAALLALLILLVFAVFDYFLFRQVDGFPLAQVWLCRAVICAVLLHCVLKSLTAAFCNDRTAHATLLSGVAVVVAGELLMIALVPPSIAFNGYFVALCMATFYLFGFLHLRARPVMLAGLATLGAVIATHGALLGTGRGGLLPEVGYGILFLANMVAIGLGMSIKLERNARRQFQQECELSQMNARLGRRNAQLADEKEENQIKAQALIRLKDEQRSQALRASQETARFLAAAAHDLRQPMFGLGLALEAMQRALDSGDTGEAKRLTVLSIRSARTMATTFNAVLDLSRLESGFVAPDLSHFDINDLLREAVAELGSFAQSRGVALHARMPVAPIVVVSDRQMLSRIVRNLVSNGIKYARHDGARGAFVLIGAVRLQTRIRIDVMDNGIGIPAQQWHRVFEPFVQLDNAERDREKGLGLGLSIVSAMVALLPEHRLEFKSAVGLGTRFSIDVPRGVGMAGTDPAPAGDPAVADLHGLYVLVVEDDCLVRTAMEALLGQWGMLVDTAAGIAEARTLAAGLERVPDLIITDFRLPDGATAADVLDILLPACGDGDRCPPVLAVTGEVEAAMASLAGRTVAVLSKPVHPERLKAAIAQAVSQASTSPVEVSRCVE
ncbi:ATP-binding response regulator [Pseudoduganella lutea]|uniref:histidine kinase n=1 Tax=Pseudoduganella lutea TaxID=321985 RepID=A0A4V0Z3U4_9BURK|nr:HAMP domain-containing sensor histidine kinase [Pseudoduganella lutea]QBE64653.1 response regulator [Pseudoduganella lutea]